jgi:hypothetical protein
MMDFSSGLLVSTSVETQIEDNGKIFHALTEQKYLEKNHLKSDSSD